MKLSIIMPAYNERRTIEQIVARVLAVELPAGMTRELIIVDDASKDGTADILAGTPPEYGCDPLQEHVPGAEGSKSSAWSWLPVQASSA